MKGQLLDNEDLVSEKPTILVVDDTPTNLTLMINLLKDDYKVKIASNGEKALTIAMSDTPPDLILLDIMMPDMDGYEVCQRLKCDPRSLNIPIIFLTAKTEMEEEQKGLELGAVDFITKPISPPIVMARVKNYLALKSMSHILQEKNTELETAKTWAEKANLAKSEFLSSMSHELRSPLNAILGFAQLLESDNPPPNPNQKDSISQILQAGWHLLNLINEILDLSKIESGHVAMSLEPVVLDEVMLECQCMIEPQAYQSGIGMSFYDFDNSRMIMADRTRLKQVIINFLSNAIKYNRKNGHVKVGYNESTPGRMRISIQDTGAGLSTEQLSQLFMPFNRLGQEAGAEEGTGIGLVVAKQLVELMGGSVGVESTVGVGSLFRFELNAASEPKLADQHQVDLSFDIEKTPRATGIHNLLYIEDNPANMKLIEQIITRYPHLHLLKAINGKSGLKLAQANLPDVILLDIHLPDISGLDVLKILLTDPATRHIPVIALSANAMPIDIKRGLQAGFFRYLTKPIKVNEFMETLNTALDFSTHENKLFT